MYVGFAFMIHHFSIEIFLSIVWVAGDVFLQNVYAGLCFHTFFERLIH